MCARRSVQNYQQWRNSQRQLSHSFSASVLAHNTLQICSIKQTLEREPAAETCRAGKAGFPPQHLLRSPHLSSTLFPPLPLHFPPCPLSDLPRAWPQAMRNPNTLQKSQQSPPLFHCLTFFFPLPKNLTALFLCSSKISPLSLEEHFPRASNFCYPNTMTPKSECFSAMQTACTQEFSKGPDENVLALQDICLRIYHS